MNVAPGINDALGTFGKTLSVALEIDIPHSNQIAVILKIKYSLPSLIRNVAPGKKSKN